MDVNKENPQNTSTILMPTDTMQTKNQSIDHDCSKDLALQEEEENSKESSNFLLERWHELIHSRSELLRTIGKKLLLSALLVIYFAYFIAVLMIPSSREKEQYWCSGDGLLIIITTLGTCGFIYSKFIRPCLLNPITTSMQPVTKIYKSKKNKSWFQMMTKVTPLIAFVVFLYFDTADDRTRLVPLFGVISILFVSCLFSVSPKNIKLYQVYWGIGLQIAFGLLILRTSVGRGIFQCAGDKFTLFLHFTEAGTKFAFGETISDMNTYVFSILTVVLFFGMAVSTLYYYGILQWVIIKVGWVLENTMGTTPCESMATAANIFLGQSEAPLVILPYVPQLTKSELHAVLTGGFSTVAGGVLSAYISFGVKASHLISASIMSAPAALAISKIFYPEIESSRTSLKNIKIYKGEEKHLLHAVMNGLSTSLALIGSITASLISFLALATFLNSLLDWSCQLLDYPDGTCNVQILIGYTLMPIAWLIGIPWADCLKVGNLLGTKIMLTEFVSYKQLGDLMKNNLISDRSVVITTYALCGFSSLASLGCSMAALGSMAPNRRKDIAGLIVRSMIAGNLACYLTAAVAGTLTTDTTVQAFNVNETIGLTLSL